MNTKELLTSFSSVQAPDMYANISMPKIEFPQYYRQQQFENLQDNSETPQEDRISNIVWRVKEKHNNSNTINTSIKGSEEFEKIMDQNNDLFEGDNELRQILTKIAKHESGFNFKILNSSGAPAWGAWQFMQGNYRGVNHNNIKALTGLSVDEFLNKPEALLKAAIKLARLFEKGLTVEDKKKIKEQGLNRGQALYGMWFAGLGGFRKYLNSGANLNDGAGATMKSILEKMK